MIWRGRDDYPGGEQTDPAYGEPGADSPPVGSRVESVLEAAERAAAGIRQDAEEWARRYLDESRRKADDIAAQRVRELSDLTDNLMNRARAVAQQSDELIAALDEAGRRLVGSALPGGNASAPPEQYGPATVEPPAPPPPAAPGPPPAPASAPQPQYAPPPPAPPPPAPAAPAPPAEQPGPPPPPAPPAEQPGPPPPPAQPMAPGPLPPPPAPGPPPAYDAVPEPPAPPAGPPPPPPAVEQPGPPPQPSAGAGGPEASEGARLLATQMAVAGSTRDEIAWRLREEFGIHDATAILDEIGL